MTPSPTDRVLMSLVFQLAAWDGPQCILPEMGQDSGLVSLLTRQSYAYLVTLRHLLYTVSDTNN